MRIISNFQDFYDVVMRQGMDKDVVYLRESKKIKLDQNYGINFDTHHDHYHPKTLYRSVDFILLGYCGQIFKIYTVDSDNKRHIFYNYSDFKDFMLQNNFGNKYEFDNSRWWPGIYRRLEDFNTSKLLELFHKYQTPLFIVSNKHFWGRKDETTISLGPCLKDLAFYKIKDPYTTYQDIFQYVSGVLNQLEAKMMKITDKDKAAKHGFNEWSFKKLPGGKKRHKK